jgi:hypothetical protein
MEEKRYLWKRSVGYGKEVQLWIYEREVLCLEGKCDYGRKVRFIEETAKLMKKKPL